MMFHRFNLRHPLVAGAVLAALSTPGLASVAVSTGYGVFAGYNQHEDHNLNDSAVTLYATTVATGAGSFAAFCIEPLVQFTSTAATPGTNSTYDDPVELAATTTNYGRIVNLFDKYYATASAVEPDAYTANTTRFAMQAALWELMHDDANIATGKYQLADRADTEYDSARLLIDFWNDPDFGFGFTAQPTMDALALDPALVATMLTESLTAAPVHRYNLMSVNHGTSQDMLMATSAVPEPASYALLLAGAAALSLGRRKPRDRSRQGL